MVFDFTSLRRISDHESKIVTRVDGEISANPFRKFLWILMGPSPSLLPISLIEIIGNKWKTRRMVKTIKGLTMCIEWQIPWMAYTQSPSAHSGRLLGSIRIEDRSQLLKNKSEREQVPKCSYTYKILVRVL
jgi:hypothetical protein